MAATKPKPVVTAQHETTANNFDAFVREHRDRLVRIAAKRTGDWASAEDAVQDTLIKLWLDQADQTYALKVAPSHAKWGAVTQKRRWDIPIAYLDIVAAPDPAATSATSDLPGLADPAAMGKILALLGRLTPHRRAVVEMRSLQGMPVKQIAEQLGIKPQSVNTMFRRGLRDLTRLAGGLPLRKAQAPHQTSPSPNPRIPPWPADKQPCARCGRRKPLHGRGLDLECWQIARRDGSLERYPRRRTYAQVVEEYQALRSAGLPADDIGRRMGYASTASMRAAVRSARMYVTREGQ